MLRVRRLQLRVVTSGPTFGCDLEFTSGLNILHAKNTSGKSTCIMAGLYALGLEGAITSRHEPPLTPALKTQIEDDDGQTHAVVQSWVQLEVENEHSQVVTFLRHIKDSDKDTHLITVIGGAAISEPSSSYSRTDYFVRRPGSATREAGFHSFLVDYLGLELPEVHSFSGGMIPLYLECLVPYLFVEQKTGWSSVQRRMPTYLGIRDVGRRSSEYLLNLDIAKREIDRQKIREEQKELKDKWRASIEGAASSLRSLRARLYGFPTEPVASWPGSRSPRVAVLGDDWVDAEAGKQEIADLLEALVEEEIPAVSEVSERLEGELAETEQKLADVIVQFRTISLDLSAKEEELRAVDRRLRSLEVDLERNTDAKTLNELGGDLSLSLAEGVCPTCRQSVSDTLLGQDIDESPMTIQDNIDYLKGQKGLFERIRLDVIEALDVGRQRRDILAAEASELRRQIRSQKETLVADGRQPSIEAIRRRLNLEDRLEQIDEAQNVFESLSTSLSEIAENWRGVLARLAELGDSTLTQSDYQKLRLIESSVKDQLRQYGFSSVPNDQVAISSETFRPIHDGFDLSFDLSLDSSASDMIRIIWAYLLALLEVSVSENTHHAGLLVLDEPKQQGAHDLTFLALVERAGSSLLSDKQIIFASSEDDEELVQRMEPHAATFHSLHERWLRPVSE